MFRKKIIFLMGPTCVGKTDISIKLMNKFNLEIISVDSCMIYKNMNIGTGKPKKKILKTFKHYLVDILEPNEEYSVHNFCENSMYIINKCIKKTPLLVGGSMMYFWVLNNIFLTKKFKILNIAIIPSNKYKLQEDIKNRLFNMIKNNFIEEVYFFYNKKNSSFRKNIIKSIGYKDFLLYLNGKKSFENSIKSVINSTILLSIKQIKWLKKWKQNIFFLENEKKKIFTKLCYLINKYI